MHPQLQPNLQPNGGRPACLDEDPDLFFPASETGPAAERQIAEAKAVCARCPVRRSCLDWALQERHAFGVWGGLTSLERQDFAASLWPVAQ